MTDIHPLTIVDDRYGGTYSGASFTAWYAEFYDVPREIDGNDVDCVSFWCDFASGERRYLVGFGETPDEAHSDLAERMRRFEAAFKISPRQLHDLPKESWQAFINAERPKTRLWDFLAGEPIWDDK